MHCFFFGLVYIYFQQLSTPTICVYASERLGKTFSRTPDQDFLHTIYGYLRFYPWIIFFILPMLSYPGCHVRASYIGCIVTHAHGRQVTSLLC